MEQSKRSSKFVIHIIQFSMTCFASFSRICSLNPTKINWTTWRGPGSDSIFYWVTSSTVNLFVSGFKKIGCVQLLFAIKTLQTFEMKQAPFGLNFFHFIHFISTIHASLRIYSYRWGGCGTIFPFRTLMIRQVEISSSSKVFANVTILAKYGTIRIFMDRQSIQIDGTGETFEAILVEAEFLSFDFFSFKNFSFAYRTCIIFIVTTFEKKNQCYQLWFCTFWS